MAPDARTERALAMVRLQAKCSTDEALALMENTAEATEGSLDEIIALVLSGEVRFD